MPNILEFSDKSKPKQYFTGQKDFADAAHRWLDAEYQPVAWHTYTKSDGKQETKPFQWKKKILSITHEDVPKYFDTGCVKISIRSGIENGGLVNIDLDSNEAVQLAPEFLLETQCVFGRSSNLGSHWLYRVSGVPTVPYEKFQDEKGDMVVEILGDNRISTVPPSIWMKEEPYEEYRFDPSRAGLPNEIAYADLLTAVRRLAAASVILRAYPKMQSNRHQIAMALSGVLLRADLGVEDTKKFIEAIAKAANDPEVADRLEAVNTTAAKLAKDEACWGWPKLAELLGDEVWAAKGWLDEDAGVDETEANSTVDYVSRIRSGAAWETAKFPLRTALIEGVIFERSLNMVFGPTGVGKSLFCLKMALSLAKGEDFLAWAVPTAEDVLYIDAELDPDQFQHARLLALSPQVPKRFHAYLIKEHFQSGELDFNLNNPAIREAVEAMIESVKPGLVVFDNLSKLVRGFDKNAAEEWESFLGWCDILMQSHDCALLIVHHAGKSGDQLGSVVQEIGLETNIHLTSLKDSHGFKVSFKKTRNRPPEPSKLEVNIVENGKWILLEPIVATHDGGKYDYDILKFVAAGGNSQTEIAEKLGLKGPNGLTPHIKKLKAQKYLNEGSGLKGGLAKLGEALIEQWKANGDGL